MSARIAITWAEGPVLNSPELRAWEQSLLLAAPDARVFILSPERTDTIRATNVIHAAKGRSPSHRRWNAYRNFLFGSFHKSTAILLTDCRDIVFQADPFQLFEPDRLLVASEGWATQDNSWNMEQRAVVSVLLSYLDDLNEEVINGGVQLGSAPVIQLVASCMEAMMMRDFWNDQAVFNYWLRSLCPVSWAAAPAGWYLHGERTAQGKQLILSNNGLYQDSKAAEPAVIFHQYDRTVHGSSVLSKYQG